MLENGVYFGLNEDEYHAHPALSASGIGNMKMSITDFWANSWMNPRRKNEPTQAMIIGTAYHKRILEGRAAFHAAYYSALDKSAFTDMLDKQDDLKAACKDLGLAVGGTKEVLAARLIEHDPSLAIRIMMHIEADHAAKNAGKIMLLSNIMDDIEIAAAVIDKNPVLAGVFKGGASEVSVFWNDAETGCPMKSRLDYMQSWAVIDYKTLAPKHGTAFEQSVYRSFASYGYHVQAAVYTDAFKAARDYIKAGNVNGDMPPLDGIADCEEPEFFFVFQQSGQAPIANLFKLPQASAFVIGQDQMKAAQKQFVECRERFGDDMWIEPLEAVEFQDDEFPPWAF